MPRVRRQSAPAHAIAPLPTGITRTHRGFRVYVRVQGRLYPRRFPADTPIPTMVRWRAEKRLRIKIGAPALEVPAGQTFRADTVTYLAAVRGMPSFRFREDDIALWVKIFGDRARASIHSHEIRAQLVTWRQRYAASTCNHRRTALMHLWTVLDGKSAPNPVKDVPRFREDSQDQPPRALAPAVVRALFAAMQPSATKARLQLMAWTGWPHTQIAQLTKTDIDWQTRLVFVRGRHKGRGTAGRWMPLLPRGWAALRLFVRFKAWGRFSTSAARTSFRLAATHVRADKTQPAAIREAVVDITPYDLRHSFLTLIAAVTQDDRAVAALGLHADRRQVLRYTKAATDARVTSALGAVTTVLKQARKAG